MSTAEVRISRASLSESALTITDDGSIYRFTEDGVGYVVQSVRVSMAPDSINVDGSEVIGFAREATSLFLEFHVIGTSASDLASKVADMEDALYRLDYEVTRTVDDVADTYLGGPCALVPKRAVVDSGVLPRFFDTFTVTIPFPNPHSFTSTEDES